MPVTYPAWLGRGAAGVGWAWPRRLDPAVPQQYCALSRPLVRVSALAGISHKIVWNDLHGPVAKSNPSHPPREGRPKGGSALELAQLSSLPVLDKTCAASG